MPAPATGQLKDPAIGSRALTDVDMTKYVAILGEVTAAIRGIKEPSSMAGLQQIRAATIEACEKQGWGNLDYGVVDARVKAALQHIRMEATVPVPADKKALVELVRAWKARIDSAKT
jgi:hypothetical protein